MSGISTSKKILVAPLDWGLGHATRCIPVIQKFSEKGCEVYIAGSGAALELLQLEFPSLKYYKLPGYDPVYPKNGSMVWKMALQLPKFIHTINAEHNRLEELVKEHNIDFVISDNRYGCWSSRVPSVLITHQSNILMPKRFGWLSGFVKMMTMRMIKKFSHCWIPDLPNESSLAGALVSFGKYSKENGVDFIGSLSRFKPCKTIEKKYDVMVICSGPEPQRSVFEGLIMSQLFASDLKFLVVRGVVKASDALNLSDALANREVINFLTSDHLWRCACQSEYIIARSGYSTIMDMKSLGRKFICIPTPGQTEQEYLALRLKEKGIAFSMPQHEFDLRFALEESKNYDGFTSTNVDYTLLSKAIDKLLDADNLIGQP